MKLILFAILFFGLNANAYLERDLQATLLERSDVLLDGKYIPTGPLVALYEKREYSAAFVDQYGANLLGQELRHFLAKAHLHGLDVDSYLSPRIDQLWDSMNQRDHLELEILLTHGIVQWASHVSFGRTNPLDFVEEAYGVEPNKDFSFNGYILDAMGARPQDLAYVLSGIAPHHIEYAQLYQLMEDLYEEKAQRDQMVNQEPEPLYEISANKILYKGLSNPAVPLVRERLKFFGDFEGELTESEKYENELYFSVISFQKRRRIQVDGMVGPETLKELNRHEPLPPGPEERIAKVALNMEKMRWLPRYLGDRYIIVKQGLSNLRVMERDKVALKMKVIVGQSKRPTPMIFDDVTYMIMRPYWTVPNSIARRDKIKKGANWLASHGYYLVQYTPNGGERRLSGWSRLHDAGVKGSGVFIRQPPGPDNALGLIQFKFTSSSQSDIYMHDTNARNLFEEQERYLSSGCIRLEKPFEFGAYVMRETKWNPYTNGQDEESLLRNYVNNPSSKAKYHVNLPESIPIYVIYLTAELNEEGQALYSDDPYGIDKALSAKLKSLR